MSHLMKIIEFGMILKANFILNHLKIPERDNSFFNTKKQNRYRERLPANGKYLCPCKNSQREIQIPFLVFTKKIKNILSVHC